jgi:hypothetical protein
MVSVTVPGPVASADGAVTHGLTPVGTHAQPAAVVTVTGAVPPAAETSTVVGDTS